MADTDPTNPTPEEDSLGTWQQELSELLALAKPVLVEVSLGKRKENNWKTIKWTFISTVVLGSLLAYLIFSAKMLGFQADPITTAVARVQITGTISPAAKSSAERIVPLIERACSAKHVNAVLLDINSGGGSPSESERIISAMNLCKAPADGRKPKKVYALINGAGASAAYMIAMHADEVYAGRYSIVGSIGAIIRYNDLSELANKHGLKEHTFRSAPLKSGPSLISGASPDDLETYQTLVETMGTVFLDEVKATRADRLKIPDELLFSGRVWTAHEALDHGLIDQIAVLEDLKQGVFKDATIHDYKQKRSFADGMGIKAAMRELVAEVLEPRFE